jgi:hypothetical protein
MRPLTPAMLAILRLFPEPTRGNPRGLYERPFGADFASLRGLERRRLVYHFGRGWYGLTEAGRAYRTGLS